MEERVQNSQRSRKCRLRDSDVREGLSLFRQQQPPLILPRVCEHFLGAENQWMRNRSVTLNHDRRWDQHCSDIRIEILCESVERLFADCNVTTSSFASVRSGKGIFSGSYPRSTRTQWPTGGRGIWCFSQIFASPTSESPYSFASLRIGVLQTCRYNSARVTVSAFSEDTIPSEFVNFKSPQSDDRS
jgi:hypothetical protein